MVVDVRDARHGLLLWDAALDRPVPVAVTAGARARQLLAGSVPRVEVGEHKKTTVAAREVLVGAVSKITAEPPAPVEPAAEE